MSAPAGGPALHGGRQRPLVPIAHLLQFWGELLVVCHPGLGDGSLLGLLPEGSRVADLREAAQPVLLQCTAAGQRAGTLTSGQAPVAETLSGSRCRCRAQQQKRRSTATYRCVRQPARRCLLQGVGITAGAACAEWPPRRAGTWALACPDGHRHRAALEWGQTRPQGRCRR